MAAAIPELAMVALTRDLNEHGLKCDDVGVVVMVYDNGIAYEVEFVAPDASTIALVTLPADALRPIRPGE